MEGNDCFLLIIMKKYRKEAKIFLFLILMTMPTIAFGQIIINTPPCCSVGFEELFHSITTFVRNIVLTIVAPILFIFAGTRFYLAKKDKEKKQKAVKIFKWTAIGMFIVLAINGITAIFKYIMEINN